MNYLAPPPKKIKNDVFVYIIAHRSSYEAIAPIKIGVSADPNKRFLQIQTANPYPVNLFYTFRFVNRKYAMQIEEIAHRDLGDYRMCGEWFNVSPFMALSIFCQGFHEVEKLTNFHDDATDLLENIGVLRADIYLQDYVDQKRAPL